MYEYEDYDETIEANDNEPEPDPEEDPMGAAHEFFREL